MNKVVVMFVSAAALATVGMAAASNSMAASDQSSSSNAAGVFISGSLGYGYAGYRNTDFFGAPTKVEKGALAWNANLGYQFNQYAAIEGGYSQFGEGKSSIPNVDTMKTNLRGFGFDVKGIMPVSNQFDLFAKAGAVDMHESVTSKGAIISKLTGSAWTPELGVGTAYNVNSNVALTLQDVYTFRTTFSRNGAKAPIPYTNDVLAGLSYKFNV